jgi:hypothetical protein
VRRLVTAGIAALVALAGCGSGEEGLEGPEVGKAKSFELVGLEDTPAVAAGEPARLALHIEQPEGGPLTRFKTGSGPHTGVHLIMVRKDLSRIVHRHPPVAKDGTIEQEVAFPAAGPWQVVADVYPDLGANTIQNFQLTGAVDVEGKASETPLPAFRGIQEAGGVRFAMRRPGKLKALEPEFLDVDVRDAQGRPARFDEYYGALAHAIFFREGSLTYFHTHVCGAGAKGCASSVGGESISGETTTPGKLRVGMLLPSPGTWRLFLQTRVDGRVVTVPYTLKVT